MDDTGVGSDDEGGTVFDAMQTESTGPIKSANDILHEQLQQQLSLQQRMKEIAVPTSDELVKARLIELEEPIILFGESVRPLLRSSLCIQLISLEL